MAVKKDDSTNQDATQCLPVRSNTKKRIMVYRLCLFLALLLIPIQALSITIIKKVGHGDCYVVISDGRVVVIDVGPSNAAGLVSLLKTGYVHYDRIVITHIHSDHVGGLITAEQYAREHPGAAFSTDMLVSNHGEHDLHLVLRDAKVGPLMAQLRGRPIVGMNDAAIAKLALTNEHLEMRGFAFGNSGSGNENKSSLLLKVTEIRDGQRRATLFFGDMEKAEQLELFRHPEAKEIFRDVAAVTLPHHGRPRTLLPEFFDELKKISEGEIVALHSDAKALDRAIAQQAKEGGIKVISTASAGNVGKDVVVNLFSENTHYQVGRQSTTLSAIVEKTRGDLADRGNFTPEEVLDAVSKYSNREASATLSPGTVLSTPSETWIAEEIQGQRQTVEEWITKLKSGSPEEASRAESELSKRVYRLNEEQIRRINAAMPGAIERWEATNATASEREIKAGLAKGWAVASNSNIDEEKLFIQTKWRNEDSPGISKYIVRDGANNTWKIYGLGPRNGKGIISYGKPLGVMRKPASIDVVDYEVCEYCGRKAIGWCHMREKHVCQTHRYFTQGGINWQCP